LPPIRKTGERTNEGVKRKTWQRLTKEEGCHADEVAGKKASLRKGERCFQASPLETVKQAGPATLGGERKRGGRSFRSAGNGPKTRKRKGEKGRDQRTSFAVKIGRERKRALAFSLNNKAKAGLLHFTRKKEFIAL